MRAILCMARKDLVLLWRDKFGMFWILVFPLMFALFFGAISSGGGGSARRLRVAVVDEDGGASARAFVKRLAGSSALRVTSASSLASVKDQVRRGKLVAYVRLKKGFGDSGDMLFGGRPLPIEVGIDPKRKAEGGYLEGVLVQTAFQGMQEMFSDPSAMRARIARARRDIGKDRGLKKARRETLLRFMDELDRFVKTSDETPGARSAPAGLQGPRITRVPVTRDTTGRPRSAFEVYFPSAILWGVLGCVIGFAISIVTERSKGTLHRLRLAPVSIEQILLGKGVASFAASILVICVLLAVGRVFFGVRLGSPLHLAMAACCTAFGFVGLTMFISVLGKTEQGVGGAGWAIMMVMAMSGGGMIPLIAMPDWLLTISHVSPVKWAIVGLEGAIWREFSTAEMLLPCGILLGVGLVFSLLGASILRRRVR